MGIILVKMILDPGLYEIKAFNFKSIRNSDKSDAKYKGYRESHPY